MQSQQRGSRRRPTSSGPLLSWVFVLTSLAGPSGAEEIPKVDEVAPDFTLESLGGGKVHLADVAARGPVVLVVLRGYPGYQCPVCSAQVADLRGQSKSFSDLNSRVILVYPGPAADLKARADEFVKGKALPENFELVLDPDYSFTRAYGLRWDAANETAYPSTFVLDRDLRVRFARVSRTHAGRAKSAEILESLRRIH